ncbi:hypothetical protein [Exiguobacterium antarcticum]|uniref:hypothetical protein n=1 Tax=Exiguobacterium antarcticum TaxID=132920 RepID=UPI0002DDE049|nr:hypothetical protein [Exiguobacterium antarcticum]
MQRQHALLNRLDQIGRQLEQTQDAWLLLGLGSVGQELERLDAYSDLDFFVITKPGQKQRFLDRLDWLESVHPLSFIFQNTVDGFKSLFADGIFLNSTDAGNRFFTGADCLARSNIPGR